MRDYQLHQPLKMKKKAIEDRACMVDSKNGPNSSAFLHCMLFQLFSCSCWDSASGIGQVTYFGPGAFCKKHSGVPYLCPSTYLHHPSIEVALQGQFMLSGTQAGSLLMTHRSMLVFSLFFQYPFMFLLDLEMPSVWRLFFQIHLQVPKEWVVHPSPHFLASFPAQYELTECVFQHLTVKQRCAFHTFIILEFTFYGCSPLSAHDN